MNELDIIRQRLKNKRIEKGYSYQALADKTHLSKSTLQRYETGNIGNLPLDKLKVLADALGCSPGYLMGWDDDDDSIPPGFIPVPEMKKVPLVGRIACGTPILAQENIEDYVDVPKDRHVDFCLTCAGDSMIDAGIDDGDTVYIRKQPDVENGEIAAVRIGDEATLKRVYKYPDCIVLEAENRAYAPLRYFKEDMNNVVIEGKAVGWVHWV